MFLTIWLSFFGKFSPLSGILFLFKSASLDLCKHLQNFQLESYTSSKAAGKVYLHFYWFCFTCNDWYATMFQIFIFFIIIDIFSCHSYFRLSTFFILCSLLSNYTQMSQILIDLEIIHFFINLISVLFRLTISLI